MLKFGKISLLIVLTVIVAVVFCSCGSLSEKDAAVDSGDGYVSSAESLNDAQSPGNSKQLKTDRKIIEYIDLSVETKTFDKLIDGINEAVKKSGGYIENSQIGGNSYYGSDSRSAQIIARIPKTNQSDFSDYISKNSNVVNSSVNTEDVTDNYIDTQSRIKALTLEKETLEKLLAKSENVSDTMAVYEKLTAVITEIESYQSKLNQMDNLIDYTTFTINISEVERVTQVEKQNWFVKTWNGLLNNFVSVGTGLLNFLSFMISALPYWILIGIIPLVIILIIRHFKKKRAKNRK